MTSPGLVLLLLAAARSAPLPEPDSLTPSSAVDSPLKAIQEDSYVNKFMSSVKNFINHVNQRIPDKNLENIKCELIVPNSNETDGFIFKYLKGKLYPGRTPIYSDKKGENIGPSKYMEIHFIDNSDLNKGNQLVIKLPESLSPYSEEPDKHYLSTMQNNDNMSGSNINISKGVDEANSSTTGSSERYISSTEKPVLLHNVSTGVHMNGANNHSMNVDENVNIKEIKDYSANSILFEATTHPSFTNTGFLNSTNGQDSENSSETYIDESSQVTSLTTAENHLFSNKTSIYSESGSTIENVPTLYSASQMQSTRSEASKKSTVISEGTVNFSTIVNRSEPEVTYPVVNNDTQDYNSETTKSINRELEYTNDLDETENTSVKSTSDLPSFFTNIAEEGLLNKSTKLFNTESENTSGVPISTFSKDNKDRLKEMISFSLKNDSQDVLSSTESPITESDYIPDLLLTSIKNENQDQISEATKSFNAESEYTPGFTPSFENNFSQGQQTETSVIFNDPSDNNPGLSSSLLNNNQDQIGSTDSIHSESEFAQKLSPVSFTNDNQDQMRKTTEAFNIESKDIPGLTSLSLNNDNQVQMTKENESFNTDSEYAATQSLSLTSLNSDNNYYHSEATRSFNTELANTSGLSLSPDSNDSRDQLSETTKLFNTQSNDTSDLASSSFINNNQDFQTKETKSLITESEFTQGLSSSPVSKDNQYNQSASTESFNTVSENTPGLSSPLINNNGHQDELTKSTKSLNTDSEYIEVSSSSSLNNKNLNFTESSSLFNTGSGNTPYISLASAGNATQDQDKKATKSFSIESEVTTGLISSPTNNDNQHQLTRNTNPMNTESEYNLPSSSLSYDAQDHLSEVTKLFHTESGHISSLATSMNDNNQDQSEESTKTFSTETDDSSQFPPYHSTYKKPYTYIETTKSSIIKNASNINRPSSIIPNQNFFNGSTLHSDTLNNETTQPSNLTPSMNNNEYDQPSETTNPNNMNSFTSTTEIHLPTDYKKISGTTKLSTSEIPTITNMSEGSTEISLEETYAKESTHLVQSSVSDKQKGFVTSNTPSPQPNSDIFETTELMSPTLDDYQKNFTTILTSSTTGLTDKWITPASEGYISERTSDKAMDNNNPVETEVSQVKETTVSYDVNNSSELQTGINSHSVTINSLSENKKEYTESTEKIDPHKAYQIEHTSATHLEHTTSQVEVVTINSFEITTENTHNSNTLIYTTNATSSIGKIPPVYSDRVNNSKSLKSDQNLTIPSRDIYDEEYTTKNYTLLGAMSMRNKKKSTPSTLDRDREITTNEHISKEMESSTISEFTTLKTEEYKPTLNQSENMSEYMASTQFTLSNSEYSVPFSTTLENLSKLPEDSDIGENGHSQYFNTNQTEAIDGLGNETTSTESTNQYDTLSTSSLLIQSSKQNNSLNPANITAIHREGKLLETDPTIETIFTLDVIPSEYLVTTQASIETSGSADKETFENHSSSFTKSMDVTSPTTIHRNLFITENKNTINSENLESTTEGHASIITNFDEDVNHTTNYPSTADIADTNIQSSNSMTMSKPTRGPRLLPTKQENIEVPSFNSTISSIPNIYQTRTSLDPNLHHYTKLLNNNNNLSSSNLSDLSYDNNNQPVIEYPQHITSTTPQYSIESDFNNFTFYVPTTEHLTLYVPAKISFRAMTKFT